MRCESKFEIVIYSFAPFSLCSPELYLISALDYLYDHQQVSGLAPCFVFIESKALFLGCSGKVKATVKKP